MYLGYKTIQDIYILINLRVHISERGDVIMDIGRIKDNKLKMILQFSLPSIIAMLLQTVITITDGYFTGNYVGENALAAINLGLPILSAILGMNGVWLAAPCSEIITSIVSVYLIRRQKIKLKEEN